jgi:hypothetical protein
MMMLFPASRDDPFILFAETPKVFRSGDDRFSGGPMFMVSLFPASRG